MEIGVPFLEHRISLFENRISLLGSRISLLENRISLLEAYAKILKVPSRMVFGHNLHYMAPFAIPRAGFCMVFQRASFVFSCPGADFGARGQIWDPQVDILAWGAFLVNFWVPKNILCEDLFCGGDTWDSILPK